MRTLPRRQRLDLEIRQSELARRAVGVGDCAFGIFAQCTIVAPQNIYRNVATVIKLQREPIPAADAFVQRTCAPFAIHPRIASDRHGFAARCHRTARGHPCERIIIRSVARRQPFLAQTAITLQRRDFARFEREINRHIALFGL